MDLIPALTCEVLLSLHSLRHESVSLLVMSQYKSLKKIVNRSINNIFIFYNVICLFCMMLICYKYSSHIDLSINLCHELSP